MIYNNNELDIIEKSFVNILNHIKNDSKKILLIINETQLNINLKREITKITNNLKRGNIVDICLDIDLRNVKENNYNVIIELPFINLNESNMNKKYFYQDFNFGYKNQYFSFVNFFQIFEIFKMKLQNMSKIRIVNIASNYYSNLFFNTEKTLLHEKISEYFNNIHTVKENSLGKKDTISIKTKKEELFEKYGKQTIEELVELLKNNSDIKEKLFYKFILNNEKDLFQKEKLNVSLINGKKGYITVKLIPPMKQREE